MDILVYVTLHTTVILTFLCVFCRGFLYDRFPRLCTILTLSIVYGCLPALVAIAVLGLFTNFQ
jgi:hypothetical protein